MCNFYFMYHTDATENLDDVYCFRNAQEFHWNMYLKSKVYSVLIDTTYVYIKHRVILIIILLFDFIIF